MEVWFSSLRLTESGFNVEGKGMTQSITLPAQQAELAWHGGGGGPRVGSAGAEVAFLEVEML